VSDFTNPNKTGTKVPLKNQRFSKVRSK